MIKEYKSIIDSVDATISPFLNDYEKICEHLRIDTSNGYAGTWVTDKFRSNIKTVLTPTKAETAISFEEYKDLEEALVYESVLYDIDNSRYLIPLRTIRDVLSEFENFEQVENWKIAIVNTKNYNLFEPSSYFYDSKNIRNDYPKEYDVAMAAKELAKYDCEIRLEDTKLVIDKTERAVEKLKNLIKEVGGLIIIRSIFEHLTNNGYYFPKLNRYLVIAQKNFIPSYTTPIIPFGYLLNLAGKYPYENDYYKKNLKETQIKINTITKIASLLSISLNIQIYGIWEGMFQSHKSLPEYIIRLALFDSICAFPSADIIEILEQIENLFLWVNEENFRDKFSFTIKEYIILVKSIIKIAGTQNGPVPIYLSTLKKATSYNIFKIQTILNVLSHCPHSINNDFFSISDYDKVDFFFHPLIKLSDTKYLLCDKSWCATAFYESMSLLTRQISKNTDSEIGHAVEEYVQRQLSHHNISYNSGNYGGQTKQKGECDIIIETEKAIVLIEIKKKVLTRKSKSGKDIEIIIDLASSLLDAQLQAGRTEIILYENHFIELEKDGRVHRIERRGRAIERITLTHLDYGSFQDRTVINNILAILVNTRMEVIDKEDVASKEKFEKIKKKCNEWERQASLLSKYDESFSHFPFFNCWFLSLSQLLLMLKFSNDNESFYETLKKTKHVTLSSNNFYYEFFISNHTGFSPI